MAATFKDRFLALKRESGLSFATIGERTGVSGQAAYRWGDGGGIEPDQAIRLAALFANVLGRPITAG
jgi:hypothetical protein